MSLYRKITNIIVILSVIGVTVTIGMYFYVVSNHAAQNLIFETIIKARIKPSSYQFGGDNLDIVFCGTGSPLSPIDTAEQCIAVFAGDQMFLIDSGGRAASKANELKLPLGRLNGIFLTHYHSDHITSLGEVHLQSWVQGRQGKLKVYGGIGIKQVTDGINLMYGHDYRYRNEHHGQHILPLESAGLTPEIISFSGDAGVVFDNEGLQITAFYVDHSPIEPAYGFRIDYRDRTVVISGDTTENTNIATIAKNTDVLIHEVLDPYMTSQLASMQAEINQDNLKIILDDTLDYHTSPAAAAEIANKAGVQLLVFNHFVPPNLNFLTKAMFLRDVTPIRSEGTKMSYDGMMLRLPTNQKQQIDIIDIR